MLVSQEALSSLHASPLHVLQGLALINGTQLITALGVEALHRAEIIAKQADIVAALTIDVLQGTPRAFDAGIAKLAWQQPILSECHVCLHRMGPCCTLALLC